MHALHLADLASVLAIHGSALLYQREMLPEEAIQGYWVSSRQRADVWHARFGALRRAEDEGRRASVKAWWEEHAPLIDEVMLAEPLARVLAALGSHLDASRPGEEVSPITLSVYHSHLEARNRALKLILATSTAPLATVVRLNKLRSLAERWSDALLGHLWAACGSAIESLAFDSNRMRAFGDETLHLPRGMARDAAGWLLSAAMREALARCADPRAASPQENRRVADAALLCLRPDLFDAVGTLRSLWLHRLERGADQTDRVLRQLASVDITTADMLGGYEMIRGSGFGRW